MLPVWAAALVLSVTTPFVPNDPGYLANEPALAPMSLGEAWALTQGDPSIVIAVIDSGVLADPDLQLTGGYNVLDGSSNTTDENGHGTAMAAIAAATIDNGIGIAGICGRCRVMPIKISGTDGVATAIDWAIAHGASVIAVPSARAVPAAAVNSAIAHGIPVFVPAADGPSPSLRAVRVGDVKEDVASANVNAESAFTTFGPSPGPGGAPAATAAVAGIAGLMLSCNPALTPAEIKQLLVSTSGREVDAYRAVVRAGCRASTPDIVRLLVRVRGRGTVTRFPADDTFNAGTVLFLRAKPQAGWKFVRWRGVCRGRRATCTVRLRQSGVTTAYFRKSGHG